MSNLKRTKEFLRFTVIWVACNLSIPFWMVGHVHLTVNIYEDLNEIIASMGMNWQHCARQVMFPSHSFEQYYQAIRRSWRFGQKRNVTVDVITSEGEANVLNNLQRKAEAAEKMFANLVSLMNDELKIESENLHTKQTTLPSWLPSTK